MNDTPNETFSRHPRRTPWVPGNQQLSIGLWIFSFCAVVLVFNLMYFMFGLWEIDSGASSSFKEAVSTTRGVLMRQFWLALGFGLVLSVWAALLCSKVVGPLYRFRRHFEGLTTGRWDRPCKIRKGDACTDLCEALNSGVAAMTNCIEEQNETLELARAALDASPDRANPQISSVIAKIDALSQEFAKRFPVSDEAAESWAETKAPSTTSESGASDGNAEEERASEAPNPGESDRDVAEGSSGDASESSADEATEESKDRDVVPA